MKPLLAILALLCALPCLHAAELTTLKEVFAQEAKWKIHERALDRFAPEEAAERAKTQESASAFLSRIATGRSDADRKLAAKIAKANWATLNSTVLAPAEKLDAVRIKPLRTVLEKIAAAPAASAQDQTELKRLLDSLSL